MQQHGVKPVVEGGILSGVAIVFALISAYMPVIGPFVNMIWPVPIILLGVRQGFKWSILATLAAAVIIAMFVHPLQAVGVVVGFALIGIVLGHALREDFSAAKTLVWGAAASLLSKVAVLAIMAVILGVNPLTMQTDIMEQALKQAESMYRSMGMSESDLAEMVKNFRQIIEIVKVAFPAGLALVAVMDTFLNFKLAGVVLKKLGHTVRPFPAFKDWRMPPWIAYFYILAFVGLYWGATRELTLVYNTAVNVQFITAVFLLIQGLALCVYAADHYKIAKVIRGVLLVIILFNNFMTQFVILVGVFDMVFHYRRFLRQRQ